MKEIAPKLIIGYDDMNGKQALENSQLIESMHLKYPGRIVNKLNTLLVRVGVENILKLFPDDKTRFFVDLKWYDTPNDQKRVMTPYDAISEGATDIVMSRGIWTGNPIENIERAFEQMDRASR